MDDVRAVMDAAGSTRAFLFGISESGPMCMLLAASYPERAAGLVLCNTFARGVHARDYPWGLTAERWDRFLQLIEKDWGTGITATIYPEPRG